MHDETSQVHRGWAFSLLALVEASGSVHRGSITHPTCRRSCVGHRTVVACGSTNSGNTHDTASLQQPLTSTAIKLRDVALERALQYYEHVWSQGRVTLLDTIMSEDHEQHDMVWQPSRIGQGRKVMKRGILAYRMAYPDLCFRVLEAACSGGDSRLSAGGTVCGPAESVGSPSTARHNSESTIHTADEAPAAHSNSMPSGSVSVPESMASSGVGPSVLIRWHATGTNLGPIREQPPTGKPVSFSGMSQLCFDSEGMIKESFVFRQAPDDERTYFLSQMQQSVPQPSPQHH